MITTIITNLEALKMIEKECPNCLSLFKTYPSINKVCCSRSCRGELTKKETYEKYKVICKVCESEFLPPRPKDGADYCSYKCSGISMRKERVDRNGYWYVFVENHPNRNKQGYVPEHHLIMEKKLGHFIEDGFVVHHINEDKKDNRIENLEYMSSSEHNSLHIKENHKKGVINTAEQRKRASKRMKENNPYVNCKRGKDGRFIKSL